MARRATSKPDAPCKRCEAARDALVLARIYLHEFAVAGNIHARRDLRKIDKALRKLQENA